MSRRAATAERLVIPGPVGPLEALVESGPHEAAAVAVVCHPHPLHGGAMTNKVAYTLARAFTRVGAVSVRFNFRGVGASAGTHAGGEGERDDAVAVASWARAAYPGLPLYLGGFSFGAGVAASVASGLRAALLVTVAPPVARLAGGVTPPGCPWLIVHGSEDELVPLGDVTAWRAQYAPTARLVVLEGATHFFHGRLTELSERVESFVRDAAGQGAADAADA
ncbi:MAG TPA: alpha/beta hydrolase [Gammaproteobacteria bacterium]